MGQAYLCTLPTVLSSHPSPSILYCGAALTVPPGPAIPRDLHVGTWVLEEASFLGGFTPKSSSPGLHQVFWLPE